jgi:hypothetical protein
MGSSDGLSDADTYFSGKSEDGNALKLSFIIEKS